MTGTQFAAVMFGLTAFISLLTLAGLATGGYIPLH